MSLYGDPSSAAHLVARTNAQALGPNANVVLNIYLAIQIIPSHVGLPILVATFLFSKTAKRHPTLINVCISWIFSGICSSLLLYAGVQIGPEPSPALCRAQTSLLYGVTPMWAVAILMLVYYMWSFYDGRKIKPSRWVSWGMLAAPYITFAAFAIAAGVLSELHPNKVTRDRRFFYCSLHYDKFSNVMSMFTAAVCIIATVLEVRLAIILRRNWRAMREAGRSGSVDLQLIIRVIVFGVYVFCGIFFSLATMWAPKSPVPDIYAATVGMVVLLLFGSQPDVWRSWFFWRSERPQAVINVNLSRENSYNSSYESKKHLIDGDEDVVVIGRPKPAHIKVEFSHSVV